MTRFYAFTILEFHSLDNVSQQLVASETPPFFWAVVISFQTMDNTLSFNALRFILCQEIIHFSLNRPGKKLLSSLLEQLDQCIFRWRFQLNKITISQAVYLLC